jgi:hypothetical protein
MTPAVPKFFPSLLLEATQLSITLRLPLEFYQLLEVTEEDIASHSQQDVKTWLQLGSTISKLKDLTRLWIWLDHDELCSWSVVNERAIISPLKQLSGTPSLDICVYLPKLHPRLESEDRHFINKPQLFDLQRTLRQRYHAKKTEKGSLEVIHQPDFPFLIDILEYAMLPLAEVEEEERADWKNGRDVEEVVKEINEPRNENWSHLI